MIEVESKQKYIAVSLRFKKFEGNTAVFKTRPSGEESTERIREIVKSATKAGDIKPVAEAVNSYLAGVYPEVDAHKESEHKFILLGTVEDFIASEKLNNKNEFLAISTIYELLTEKASIYEFNGASIFPDGNLAILDLKAKNSLYHRMIRCPIEYAILMCLRLIHEDTNQKSVQIDLFLPNE